MAAARGDGHPTRSRKTKRKPPPDGARVVEHRAHYVISLIEDDPALDGKFGRLATMVGERFGVTGKNQKAAAVTRAYAIMAEEVRQRRPHMVEYLVRVHERTIQIGMESDPRIITGAAAELRKLTGAGEPDRIEHSGGIHSTFSSDDFEMLKAMKMTNAHRLAEIDRVERELADDHEDGGAVGTQPTRRASPPSSPIDDMVVQPTEEDDDDE